MVDSVKPDDVVHSMPDLLTDTPKEITKLCMFMEPKTPAETFERTAKYARDPKAYLKTTLGEQVFAERETQLSTPDNVDNDMYGKGEQKSHFEQHIARLLGKQHGLFFITGVQAQLTAVKIHCERAKNNRVCWHVTSHLETAEERSFEQLYGLERRLVGSDPEALPTVAEIKEVLVLPESERPAILLVEVPNRTLGCETYSFEDLAKISAACKDAGVVFHMDGARIWEIEPHYQETAGKSFADLSGLFDSVYVSFYKSLRGISGAILAHDDESFMSDARMWQRRAGGNPFTMMYETIDCERGYNENIGTFAQKRDKMIQVVDGIKAATEAHKSGAGKQIVQFLPDRATCCQIRTAFNGFTAAELEAARDKVQTESGVRVFERIWPKETLDQKMEEERRVGKSDAVKSDGAGEDAAPVKHEESHLIEWMIVGATLGLDTQVFVDAYVALCEALVKSSA